MPHPRPPQNDSCPIPLFPRNINMFLVPAGIISAVGGNSWYETEFEIL